MKHNKQTMKAFYFFILIFSGVALNAQDTLFKYYDKHWNPVEKEKAKFYGTFVKKGNVYDVKTYYLPSMKIRGITTQSDTTFNSPVGLAVLYHPNGKVSDSSFNSKEIKEVFYYKYFPNGKLSMKYAKSPGQDTPTVTGFNEDGSINKKFVVAQEAAFEGGEKAWSKYLSKNLGKNLSNPKTKNTTDITINVVVQFVINEQGFPADIKVTETSGHKQVDRDAVQIIANSPKWSPAILYNEPVRAYRKQPLTYIITVDKEK